MEFATKEEAKAKGYRSVTVACKMPEGEACIVAAIKNLAPGTKWGITRGKQHGKKTAELWTKTPPPVRTWKEVSDNGSVYAKAPARTKIQKLDRRRNNNRETITR